MGTSTTSPFSTRSSPFTQAVVSSMRQLYPESLAESSWDNTGLLLEAPYPSYMPANSRPRPSVLLTIDLTRAVADEAIQKRVSTVIAYHPVIFSGLKSLTLANSQQATLLRLAQAGISVYSPHSAVDCAPGGLGDWLADIVTGRQGATTPATTTTTADSQAAQAPGATMTKRPLVPRTYSTPTYPTPAAPIDEAGAAGESDDTDEGEAKHTRAPLVKTSSPPKGFEGAGMGRRVDFDKAQPLGALIDRIARGVGSPKGFPVAIPQGRQVDEIEIRSVAICAGSGADLFRKAEPADLYFTGELSHHAALGMTESGACVVTLFHSNTERGYLTAVMKPRLEEVLREKWTEMTKKAGEYYEDGEMGYESSGGPFGEVLNKNEFEIEVSEQDRDPYGIVVLRD